MKASIPDFSQYIIHIFGHRAGVADCMFYSLNLKCDNFPDFI